MTLILMGGGLLAVSIMLVILAKKHNQPRVLGFTGIVLGTLMFISGIMALK